MRHRVTAIFGCTSLLLGLALLVLWVRSYWRYDHLLIGGDGRGLFNAQTNAGGIYTWYAERAPGVAGRLWQVRPAIPATYPSIVGPALLFQANDITRGFSHWHVEFLYGSGRIGLSDDSKRLWLGTGKQFQFPHKDTGSVSVWMLSAPIWMLAVVVMAPGIMWGGLRMTRWFRRRRRGDRRLCQTGGYDLRATPERCPECGTAAISATAASS